jgi:hypothetical protein
MNEEQWLSCTDPMPMLEFLRGKASKRKSTLYICAGCREIWHLLYDSVSRKSVEVGELFADGQATEQQRYQAHYSAECPTFGFDFEPRTWREWVQPGHVPESVRRLVEMGVLSEDDLHEDEPEVDAVLKNRLIAAARLAEAATSVSPFPAVGYSALPCIPLVPWPGVWLLHCIFGNPFRPPPSVADSVRSWNQNTIPKLAQAIYDERAFDRLPILADALEDAGCHDADILGHCRQPGPHVRGCWAVDLLLGKS